MPNTISALTGNARIFLLLDDRYPTSYNQHPTKTFYKVTSYVNVSSQISVEGGGSASIVLNDKDMIWRKIFPFRYLNTREYGDEIIFTKEKKDTLEKDVKERVPITVALTNRGEIDIYKQLLETYGRKQKGLGKLSQIASSGDGGIIVPLVTPQNLVWIEYLSREGKWIRKFSGIVVSITDEDYTKQTPYLTLNCRTYDRLLEYSYVLTGLKNLGGKEGQSPTEIISLSNQSPTVSTVNRYYGKKFSQIVVDVFRQTNKFFLRKSADGDDYRYFKVRNIFGFGEDNVNSDGTVEQLGEKGYPIDDPIWNRAGWVDKTGVIKNRKEFNFDDPLDINRDFYPGSEVIVNNKQLNAAENTDWIQVIMAEDFWNDKKPFQNLVRTSLTLFNTDKMTPKDILEEARKIVLCYVYPDGDGSFKVERPYYDIYYNMKDYESDAVVPQDFDLRYIITKKDRSYIHSSYTENEAPLVTRVEMQSNPDFMNFDSTQKALLQGFSNSSLKVISKYGERIVTLKAIPTQGFRLSELQDEILHSYCFAQKLLLSTKSKSFTLELDQRPDLMLNRPMIFLDKGLTYLIHTLSESFVPGGQHKTTVKGDFVRYIGFPLFNPWRYKVERDDTLNDYYKDVNGVQKKGWVLKKWELTDPLTEERLNRVGNNPMGVGTNIDDILGTDDAITYETTKETINYYTQGNLGLKDYDGNDYVFDENKITVFIKRNLRKGYEGRDEKLDEFSFVWKDSQGIEHQKTMGGSAGDFKNQPYWFSSNINYTRFAKLNQGVWKFSNPKAIKTGNNNEVAQFVECNKFKYKIVDTKGNDVGTELLSGNYKTYLGNGHYINYDNNTNDTAYDSLQIQIDSRYEKEWLEVLATIIEKGSLEVVLKDNDTTFSDKQYKPRAYDTIGNWALYMYVLENPTEASIKYLDDSRNRIEISNLTSKNEWANGSGILGIANKQFYNGLTTEYEIGNLNKQIDCWNEIKDIIFDKLSGNKILDVVSNGYCTIQGSQIFLQRKPTVEKYSNFPIGGDFDADYKGLISLIFVYCKNYFFENGNKDKFTDIINKDSILTFINNFYLISLNWNLTENGETVNYDSKNLWTYRISSNYISSISSLPMWKYLDVFSGLKES